MSKTLVEATLFRPAPNDDIPANGYIEARPSLRRDLDDIDGTVLPAKFTARLGAALTYIDNDDVEQTAPATPGVAWLWVDATDAGEAANLWFWTFTERTDGGSRRYCTVPTSAVVVDYRALPDIDPDDYSTTPPAGTPAFAVADSALHATITGETTAAITAAVSALVAGAPGALNTLNELADALGDDANFAATVATSLATITADLAAETALARNADNLTSGTIPEARIPPTIARDTEVAAAVAALVDAAPGTLDTLNELAAALGDDPNYAATITAALSAKASTTALADEATLARNADNLTSGTIADARIPAAITRDSEVAALVAAELVAYQPGLEIGYAERTTSFTSTQTAPNATGTISGLSVTVVGTGRPVDIRFGCALSWHSVANRTVFTSLMVGGVATGAASGDSSPSTTTGPAQGFTRRMVLTNGVSYTFTVALYAEAGGGTATAFANATYPMTLSVTNR